MCFKLTYTFVQKACRVKREKNLQNSKKEVKMKREQKEERKN
jgi:hypothetical protein